MKMCRRLVCMVLPVLLLSACSSVGGDSSFRSTESSVPSSRESSALSEAAETEAAETEAREFDRADFLARYGQAQQRLAAGEMPAQPAPQDPKETGFAILPLDEEVYGIGQYAFLPLEERTLTEEEFLQLAQAMGEVPQWELMTPKRCRTGLQEEDGRAAVSQNRELTREEKLRYNALRPRYLYEGKRPARQEGQAVPLCVEVSGQENGEAYWLFPAASMTEEQLLSYLDTEFRKVSAEDYLPMEEELAYQELPAVIEAAISRYRLGDGTVPPYQAELIVSGVEPRRADRDFWGVKLCYPEGDQYTLCLYAEDGEVANWIRWSPGYFDDPDFNAVRLPFENETRSEDEVREVAEEYLRQAEPGGWEVTRCGVMENQVSSGQLQGSVSEVDIMTSAGGQYKITVFNSDLSLYSFTVRSWPEQ